MSLYTWLEGVAAISFSLIPVFLLWAFAVLWARSRSGWALMALAGTACGVIGVVAIWIDFYIHYSSVDVMRAQNADPNLRLYLGVKLCLSVGILTSAVALLGHARSRPS